MNASVKKSGFTLLELLIVILIIGLLSAISIPMYKKAVEKSKVSDALSTMQAVSKSEHGWYLVRNNYTKDFANLDIDLYDKDGNKAEDESFDSINYTYELLDSGILASRNNGEYTIYQDYDTKQIMCTPGTHFICDDLGAFTKVPCENAGMAWSKSNSTCYMDEIAKCSGLGYNWFEDEEDHTKDFCGYEGENNKVIQDGAICKAIAGSYCQSSEVNEGGICEGNRQYGCNGSTINEGGKAICTGNTSCAGLTINSSGTCEGRNLEACIGSTINNGGKCLGIAQQGCSRQTINDGGLCYGTGHISCWNAKIYEGGVCDGRGNSACMRSNIYNKGVCRGNNASACTGVTVHTGGICEANVDGACTTNYQGVETTYEGTGCCSGDFCPDTAPKCDCGLDPETGMHLTSC